SRTRTVPLSTICSQCCRETLETGMRRSHVLVRPITILGLVTGKSRRVPSALNMTRDTSIIRPRGIDPSVSPHPKEAPEAIPLHQFNAATGRHQPPCSRPSGDHADRRATGGGTGDVQGLYLHIPLCFHKCHYCDFYSVEHQADRESERQHAFVDALLAQ